MMTNFKYYFQAVAGLRQFLRKTLTLDQCREIVKTRLDRREEIFIEIVKRNIYENDRSPYLKLLKLAGCEFGDLKSSVAGIGIEKTLESLRKSGVYLTYDEFKGRREVVRAGNPVRFDTGDFNNPSFFHRFTVQTGGTTGPGLKVPVDFEYVSQTVVTRGLLFDVHDLFTVPHSIWFPILPGAAGIFVMFRNAKIGIKTSRWFSQYNKGYIHPSLKHRARTLGVVCLGRLFGADFAKPEFVSLNNAFEIAEWAACMVRYHKRCCIETYASSAVRVCHAASKHSLDISGTTFVVAGEPLSAAKRDEILSAGAQAIPVYAFTEAGAIGYGCANPAEADEVHFLRDSFAFIQHRRKAPYSDRTVDSFLFTSLRSRAPKVLLNVEIGDYGKTESRKCGCGFEKMGFTDHIHTIRSFDKLTSEGMRLEGSHLVRVIEEVLPLKFGGDSTDYQIVEEEDEKGLSRLNVFVNPSIGDVNERELLDTILGEIDIGPIPDIFSQAGTLGIKRAHPIPTPGGKILPLYLKKQKKSL